MIVFLEIRIGNVEFVPGFVIFGLVAYRFPIRLNRLVVLFKMGKSRSHTMQPRLPDRA